VQTLSRAYACLAHELAELGGAGVRAFRLTPQTADMAAVARLYRELLDGARSPDSLLDAVEDLCGDVPLANGYYHETAGALWLED
jgi:collagenase-like PrtC family protease